MIARAILFAGRYLLAAAAFVYLLAFGWMTARGRDAMHEVLFRLGLRKRPEPMRDAPPLEIPSVSARELIPEPSPVRVLEQDAADGNVTGFELLLIAQLVAARGPEACFEIGTFDGRTALNIAANTPPTCKVYTLDLPSADVRRTALRIANGDENFIRKEKAGARFAGTPFAARIVQLYGDSATFDYGPYEGKMEIVFVDGAHSAEYVRNDTNVALRLLKPSGGLILWHDYGSRYWKDLTRAMNALCRERPELRGMRHIKNTTLVVLKV